MPPEQRVYGPVPSHRLGLSLGVDLVPFKTCPYDCVYCQLGPTNRLTITRETFVSQRILVQQVRQALEEGPTPDVITLAGSGEPTLYRPLDKLIAGLRRITSVPVALLTNGALFWDAQVRKEAALADLVLPSLDAGDAATFRTVNRPHPDLGLDLVVAGLGAFRIEYAGPIWLEVMVAAGINDRPEALGRIAERVRRIRPDRVHLNTPVRPSPLGPMCVVPEGKLQELCALFTPAAEVIAACPTAGTGMGFSADGIEGRLLALLSRRPCTVEDASGGLSLPPNAVVKALSSMESRGVVRQERQGARVFFVARPEERIP